MEKVKALTALLLLFVVVGVMFCWLYLEQVDRANERLHSARSLFESTRSSLTAKKQSLQRRQVVHAENQKAGAILQKANDDYAAAEVMLKEAKAKEHESLRRIKLLLAEMTKVVGSRRAVAGQKEYPEIRTVGGKVLRMAKIRKIEDNGVTFIHTGGIGVVNVEELPEPIRTEYDLGPGSIITQLKELEEWGERKERDQGGAEEAVVAVPEPVVERAEMSANDRIMLKNAQAVLVDLQTKLSVATSNRETLVQQADVAAMAVSNAQYRGVPSTNYRISHQKAMGAVASANAYIAQVQAEISKVQLRIADLQRSF